MTSTELSPPPPAAGSGAASRLLANDTDPDKNTLTAKLVAGPSNGSLTLNADGSLSVVVGSVDISGTKTGFALLAAEAFGTPVDAINIVEGDTDAAPFAGASGGSKITYTVGAKNLSTSYGGVISNGSSSGIGKPDNVFEVHSTSTALALDGKTHYNEW